MVAWRGGLGAAVLLACLAAHADPLADLQADRAFLLMRHAHAPGIGDPEHFKLRDCDTQRNLDEQGRNEARAWGRKLRRVPLAGSIQLYSSRWCRALDTATGMDLGPVVEVPALDSFFGERGRSEQATHELKSFVDELPEGQLAVLVTHQVNITALTGIVPASGEALLIALPLTDPPDILARIPPP